MGHDSRFGPYRLASELVSDPFGTVHRGLVIAGMDVESHVLVRTYSEELLQAGLGVRLVEAEQVVALLGDTRMFGSGFRIGTNGTPLVAWDYVAGRSLAQLLDKARRDRTPFGVDQALAVFLGVARGLVQMQVKGVRHGMLSPHSVWVSFEGAAQLMDAPCADLIRSLLPQAPSIRQELAAYQQGTEKEALQQDLFALGAILFELLTFERLPVGGELLTVLDRATLKAAQEEDAPLPAEIRNLLGRLLLSLQPFATVEAFQAELERVLYGGEYSPTAFNLAFFMHTLFREEKDRAVAELKAERSADHTTCAVLPEPPRFGVSPEFADGITEAGTGPRNTTRIIAGGFLVVVILGLGYAYRGRHRVERPRSQPVAAPVLEPARLIRQEPPEFPSRAVQVQWGPGQEPVVRLKVLVGEQNQPLQVTLIEGIPGSYGFDEAAIAAASKSVFRPALRNGRPEQGWTDEISYRFTYPAK